MVNDTKEISLKFGDKGGPYWDETYPESEHDTEQKAIEYAYKMNNYATWLILPVIRFENTLG